MKYHSDWERNEEIIDICPLIVAMLELIDLYSSTRLLSLRLLLQSGCHLGERFQKLGDIFIPVNWLFEAI